MPDGEDPDIKPWMRYGRFTQAVIFALPVRDGRWHELDSFDPEPEVLDASWVDPDAAQVAEEAIQEGAQLRPVSAGRGASGWAVGLEVLGIVADTGGAIAFLVGAAAVVRKIWTRLRNTERGIISISAGTAAFLALDSAASRLSSESIRIVSYGAVDADTEISYSEHDLFWVVIEVVDIPLIEFYLVTDKGDVIFAGRGARPVDPYGQ